MGALVCTGRLRNPGTPCLEVGVALDICWSVKTTKMYF